MPIGIIINSLSIALGGAAGCLIGSRLSPDFKEKINMIFGVCAMAMGISSIILMENMPAVVFSVVIGTGIGLCIHLGDAISAAAKKAGGIFSKNAPGTMAGGQSDTLVTVIVLFCASGMGIYGSIVSGMSGGHSILIAKSILDFFTALIFACTLGIVVSLIAVPQFLIFFLLFLLAGIIYPLTTPTMINDFKACGGILLLATGFRMIRVKMFPTADMIPAMILVMPVSMLWVNYILPLVS